MSPGEPTPVHWTSDTITTKQIRELRETLFRESHQQMTDDTDATGMALIDPSEPRFSSDRSAAEWARAYGRERCAKILNARTESLK